MKAHSRLAWRFRLRLKGLSINDLHTAEQDFANSTDSDRFREMRTRGET